MTGPRPAPMEPLVTGAGRPQCCSHNYATIELGGPGWSVANKVNKLKRRPSKLYFIMFLLRHPKE